MFLKRISRITLTLIFVSFFLSLTGKAQDSVARLDEKKNASASSSSETAEVTDSTETKKKIAESLQKDGLLLSNGLLVEPAYHQDESGLQHQFSFSRTNPGSWSSEFTEEMVLVKDKHQLIFSMPVRLTKTDDAGRGLGDVRFEYSYLLFGDNSSKITVSPGFAVSLPTGNVRRELGFGAPSVSARIPVSIMLTKRFQTNSTFEMTFTNKAKNALGERANIYNYEIGQSFVWFAKPNFNLLLETVWEKSQLVKGRNLKEYEEEFFVSPGVSWEHTFKNGLTIIPGIAVPLGVGASGGERGIIFFFAFEHPFKKER